MGQTHPNAYLADAAAKREQANRLLGEAKTLEDQAVALGAELPKPSEEKSEDTGKTSESEDDSEPEQPTGPEDATSDDESGDENDPHSRRRFGRKH